MTLCAAAAVGVTPAAASAADAPVLSVTAQKVGADHAVMVNETFQTRVILRPYVPGQVVHVTFVRHGREMAAADVTLAPTSSGGSGFALVPYRPASAGLVEIRATRAATADQPELQAGPALVRALPPSAEPGAVGPTVRLLQQRLDALGYVVGERGVYDARTARAVLAFRKVTGMARTNVASSEVFRRLARGQGRFKVRHPSHGKHIEADLSRQVFALIRGSRVERIYPISSGKPSTPSPIGSFKVYRKEPGTNAIGMVHSSYFLRGYAVHGYAEVPVYAASHGCLRVPVPDARYIYDWLGVGDIVDVYR